MSVWNGAIPYARSAVFCILLVLAYNCARSWAGPLPDTGVWELLPQASCYVETDGSLSTFQRISSPELASRFSSCDTFDAFKPDAVYWIRFRTVQFPDNAVLGLQNARSGSLRLFSSRAPAKNQGAATAPAGPQFLFPALRLPPHPDGAAANTFSYLQLRFAQAPAKALRVFSTAAFERLSLRYVLALGLALGVLAAAACFALCCFLAQRAREPFLFLAFLLALLCYHLADTGILALAAPLPAAFFSSQAAVLGYLVLICFAAFSRFFLETKSHAALTDLLIRLCPFLLLGGLACLVTGAPQAAAYVGFATALLLLGLCAAGATAAIRSGLPGARQYLTAWTLLLAGLLFASANHVFVLSNTFLLGHIQIFMAALASLPLAFAQAERSALQRFEQRRTAREHGRQPLNITDELTGLYNQRFFESSLENAIESSRLTGSPLSLLMLNVDNFRRLNDIYGTRQADKVLGILGDLIRKGVRSQDVPCRFGNEEFAIILPGATENDAMHAAERFRKAFSNLFFHPDAGIRINSTLNIGVATCDSGDTAGSVFERAGQALYKAKLDSKEKIASAEQN